MAESMEGRTAVNKKTGERVIFRNGRWQPLTEQLQAEQPQTESIQAASTKGRALADQLRTLPQDMLRQGGLAVRNVVTGLTGIPGMAADAAMAGYNLATGSDQQMPSEALQQTMTRMGLPEAETGLERGLGMAQSAMAGARIPMPQVGRQAPANFKRAPTVAEREFSNAQKAGYVVPPASVKPSVGNVALESVGGKAAVQQLASGRNQEVTNALAARSVGLSENQPITISELKEIRKNAGDVYKEVKKTGVINADRQFIGDLRAVRQETKEISKDFPDADIGSAEAIDRLVKSLAKRSFDAKSAVAYMKKLRKSATANLSGMNAADPDKLSLGQAQRDAADALEEMVGRHLTKIDRPELAEQFNNARKQIAKTYTVQGALETTGNVNASKLAALLRKDKPLSPELEQAARFAGAFPKASAVPERSGSPGVSALDFAMTAGGAVTLPFIGQDPYFALTYPALRYGARNAALSKALQQGLTKQPRQLPSGAAGAAAGAYGAGQE
jgi:hypothetical protein